MAYYILYGLPADRLSWGQAIGSAAVCQSFGSKVEARSLLPRFGGAPRQATRAEVLAWIDQHNHHFENGRPKP